MRLKCHDANGSNSLWYRSISPGAKKKERKKENKEIIKKEQDLRGLYCRTSVDGVEWT